MDSDFSFDGLSDREIAERLFKRYGNNLFYYAMKSWSLTEDEVWDILYDTLYGFINSYACHRFSSEQEIAALLWVIYKNKLRDMYRHKKRVERHYQEVSYLEEMQANNTGGLEEKSEYIWSAYSNQMLSQEEAKNPIISQLKTILDSLKNWERQLLIGRANSIPYKQLEEMTGKKVDVLKVYYQRLKQQIAQELKEQIKRKEDSCPKINEME